MKSSRLILASCGIATVLVSAAAGPSAPAKTNATLLPRTRHLVAAKKPLTVVLYGDSISEVKKGWNGGAKTPETNWGAVLVKRLQEAYPDSAVRVRHFAIGGQKSNDR